MHAYTKKLTGSIILVRPVRFLRQLIPAFTVAASLFSSGQEHCAG
jgi:hypothetical protein